MAHPPHPLTEMIALLSGLSKSPVRWPRALAEPRLGETWRVLLDPAGHPFCVTSAAGWG